MQGPVKKVILLILLRAGFGFALSEYLEHMDHVGQEQDNYRLALKWARQVRRFMIRQGFDANCLKPNSAGKQQPLYTNNNSRGRQKNRRVELILKF